jgi:hypothetical protein
MSVTVFIWKHPLIRDFHALFPISKDACMVTNNQARELSSSSVQRSASVVQLACLQIHVMPRCMVRTEPPDDNDEYAARWRADG